MADIDMNVQVHEVEFIPTDELENILPGESLNTAIAKANRAITELKKFSPVSSKEIHEIWKNNTIENIDEYGAVYGAITDGSQSVNGLRLAIASNVEGTGIEFCTLLNTDGYSPELPDTECAFWISPKELRIHLLENKNYSDADIQEFIDNATVWVDPESDPDTVDISNSNFPLIMFKSEEGSIRGANDTTFITHPTVRGIRQVIGRVGDSNLKDLQDDHRRYDDMSDNITFTANNYGGIYEGLTSDGNKRLQEITIVADADYGKEYVEITDKGDWNNGAKIICHFSTANERVKIEQLLKKAGFDYSVELTPFSENARVVLKAEGSGSVVITESVAGAGVGADLLFGIL